MTQKNPPCEPNHKEWLGLSIRQNVFNLLDKNRYYSPKKICEILSLPYKKYKNYIWGLKNDWKTYHENKQHSKCSFHSWRGWCFVPTGLDRKVGVEQGWVLTRARNRWLLWKDKLGRLMWFATGRVNLWVHEPVNRGKVFQLISNGFFATRLITDVRALEQVLTTVKFKGAHAVFNTGRRLPKLVIRDFEKANGVVIRLGDNSHPKAVEVEYHYPDWAMRNECLTRELKELLTHFLIPEKSAIEHERGDVYYVV